MEIVLIFAEILLITLICAGIVTIIGAMVYAACEFIHYLRKW